MCATARSASRSARCLILTERALAARLSILMYAQTLSGVGHYVRSFEIARALGQRHDVQLVDGGRRVPRPAEHEVQRLELPRLVRTSEGLAVLASGKSLSEVLAERIELLREAVMRLRPQVLIIEHYPFSKWQLEAEIIALMAAARAACPQLLVVCSLRDIVRQTRFEDCSAEHYLAEVLRRVERDFDAIMVHGEERLTPLGASFAGSAALRVPLCYTGIVAEAHTHTATLAAPYLLVSSGGGSDPLQLAAAVAAALTLPGLRDVAREYQFIACPGLLASVAAPVSWQVRPFGADFLDLLAGAALSVSYAGYNTCGNLLVTRRRALLAIHPAMSDQGARAAVMQSLGAATVLPAAGWAPAALAESIRAALARPAPTVQLKLDGAARSAAFIEKLWEGRRGPRQT
jgi:predicted glycosyltransferase